MKLFWFFAWELLWWMLSVIWNVTLCLVSCWLVLAYSQSLLMLGLEFNDSLHVASSLHVALNFSFSIIRPPDAFQNLPKSVSSELTVTHMSSDHAAVACSCCCSSQISICCTFYSQASRILNIDWLSHLLHPYHPVLCTRAWYQSNEWSECSSRWISPLWEENSLRNCPSGIES